MATAVKPTTVRVDENLKAQANEILGSVGLSYNTYVVMVIIAAEMLRRSRLRCCGVPRCAATR